MDYDLNDVLYTAKDVAKMLQVTAQTLRNWESEFAGYVEVPRDRSGTRLYTDEVIGRLKIIQEHRKRGFGLPAIKEYLSGLKQDNLNHTRRQVATTVEATVPESGAPTEASNVQTPFEREEGASRPHLEEGMKSYFSAYMAPILETNQKLSAQIEALEERVNQLQFQLENRDEQRDASLMQTLRTMQTVKERQKKSFLGRLF